MKEIWKDIKGYEGIYEISNLGRVKSLHRLVDNGYFIQNVKEKILKSNINPAGYKYVSLCVNGSQKSMMIHTLVSTSFLGHNQNGHKIVIDHINGDRLDNRAENLRIVTQRFNCSLGFRINKDKLVSMFPGVCWNNAKNKWVSRILINGKRKFLGYFEKEIDAHLAYEAELETLVDV